MKSKKNYVLNIGSSKPVKIIDLVKLLSKNYIFIPKRPGEPNITYANIDKSKNFEMETKKKFESGLQKLVDNIDYWKNALFGVNQA